MFGCDVVGDFNEMLNQQEKLQNAIKKEHGWEVQVGWSITNGTLTNVTVLVDTQSVGEQQVFYIENAIKSSVSNVFKEQPEVLIIQLISSYEK